MVSGRTGREEKHAAVAMNLIKREMKWNEMEVLNIFLNYDEYG